MKFTLFASVLWLLLGAPWQCVALGVIADVVCSCNPSKTKDFPGRRQPQRTSSGTRKDNQ